MELSCAPPSTENGWFLVCYRHHSQKIILFLFRLEIYISMVHILLAISFLRLCGSRALDSLKSVAGWQ